MIIKLYGRKNQIFVVCPIVRNCSYSQSRIEWFVVKFATTRNFRLPGQDVLRAEESGAQVPVLPAGAGGGGVRRPASGVAQGVQGLQQHRLHGVR